MPRKPIGPVAQVSLPPKERNSRAFALRLKNNGTKREAVVREIFDKVWDNKNVNTTEWMVEMIFRGLGNKVDTHDSVLEEMKVLRDDMTVIRDTMANEIDRLVVIGKDNE